MPQAGADQADSTLDPRDASRLLAVVKELSKLRDLSGVMDVVRKAARELTEADGVTFVLREGDQVFYADENAIAPLWKGKRFPASMCISGWVIVNRTPALIEDIYADPRIPHDAYRSTFVKSLAMVPIRAEDPLGAIGAYWASRHSTTARELELLQALAGATSIAVRNAELMHAAMSAIAARDEFIGIASHELKTPLTPLMLQVQSMLKAAREGRAEGLATVERLGRVEASLRKLDRLVDNLLEISRATRDQLTVRREQVDLVDVVHGVQSNLHEELRLSGSELQVHAGGPATGRWDARLLEQALTNLVTNAIQHGQGKPIDIEVESGPGEARVTVRDRGVGIDARDQARIFERFERAVPSSHYGGFGLGLWLVRKIVEAEGGNIQLSSNPGEGSAFTIELPRCEATS